MDSNSKQIIAITGATGFIGRSIFRRLTARDYIVRVLLRGPNNASFRASSHAEIIPGDLANQESLRRLVSGADAVLHCAGSVRGATQAQFDRVNVDGTRNLLNAVKAARTGARLLFVSSLAAREPQLSFYAGSKHRAEQLLECEGKDIAWTILRPPAVYGPGDRELLPLFRLMAHGIAFTPGSPTARFSMLYVDDLSSAVVAWLQTGTPVEGVFPVHDGCVGGYDWHELGNIVGKLCDRKIRVVRTASWLLDVPAWANGRIGAAFGTAPILTPEKLRELRHEDWVCDNAEFQHAVDWRPKVQLREGLRATPNWPGYRADRVALKESET